MSYCQYSPIKGPLTVDVGVPLYFSIVPIIVPNKETMSITWVMLTVAHMSWVPLRTTPSIPCLCSSLWLELPWDNSLQTLKANLGELVRGGVG